MTIRELRKVLEGIDPAHYGKQVVVGFVDHQYRKATAEFVDAEQNASGYWAFYTPDDMAPTSVKTKVLLID